MSFGPNPFSNWGDWLIWRSTGLLGDFQMGTCISIIRTEKWSRGWVNALTEEDIRRVLARYKEHVTFWRIHQDIIQKELWEFAAALGWDPLQIMNLYESVPAQRYPPGSSFQ